MVVSLLVLVTALFQPHPPTQGGCPLVNKPWFCYRWEPGSIRFMAADLPVFVGDCLKGPDVRAKCGCEARFDYDADGDVDLRDFADWAVGVSDSGVD